MIVRSQGSTIITATIVLQAFSKSLLLIIRVDTSTCFQITTGMKHIKKVQWKLRNKN